MIKDNKSMSIGTDEFIINAFVVVVIVSAMYKKVLYAVILKADNINKIKKLFFNTPHIFENFMIKIGDTIISTNNHLKKANSKGLISSFKNLPSTKFPDQKRTQRVK